LTNSIQLIEKICITAHTCTISYTIFSLGLHNPIYINVTIRAQYVCVIRRWFADASVFFFLF
jgi:hypothetical protein